jgi:hypothetical protein
MAAVELEIVAPVCDTAFIGAVSTQLRGAVKPLPAQLQATTLYYRWYSNLFVGAPDQDRFSINPAALTDPQTPYGVTLGIGSHVIALAATDRPGEGAADMEAVQHGGVTGGSEGDGRCVVHVFVANMLWPEGQVSPYPISRSNCRLEAEAPLQWGKPDLETGVIVPNDAYHDENVNRLQYRWRFDPTGPPAGRSSFELVPDLEQLSFVVTDNNDDPVDPVRVRYQDPLPVTLSGSYTLTLFVEDHQGQLGGDIAVVPVVVGS